MTKILILDGGLGTTLEQTHSVTFDSATTPLWSSHLLVSDQETLLRCQSEFGNVPVDIILTATYQVSIQGFANTKTAQFPHGIPQSHMMPFLDAAVDIAGKARRGDDASVALSLGPYGACMVPSQEYSGRYDEEHDGITALRDWHAERMKLFVQIRDLKARISHVALETIPRRDEILAIRRALDLVPKLTSDTPFWISCLFPNEHEDSLPDGTSPEMVVRTMLDPRLATSIPRAIGINCTKVWKLASLVERYEAEIGKMEAQGLVAEGSWPALVLYPDGTNGEVYNTATKQWEVLNHQTATSSSKDERVPWEEQLARVVDDVVVRGRWPQIIVGGCCMSKPDDIRRLRDSLDRIKGKGRASP